MTGPMGRRVLKFDGALVPEGCGIAPWAISIKSALRIHLSVSYGMIGILRIGSLRSPPKGKTAEWYMKYMALCFSSPYFSFPLEGKSREAGKGVRGRAPIGCSIAVLTANRRPVSFLLLTLGHTFGVRVQRMPPEGAKRRG